MATDLTVINSALLLLGDEKVSAYPVTDGSARGDLVNELYPTIREATMTAREWPFALRRVKLFAYSEPNATLTPGAVSGTGVTFTASAAVFAAGDVGKVLRGDPTMQVIGKATIVSFTDTTHVVADITENFASTSAIASGSWRLYLAPPAFGYEWTIAGPSQKLRITSVKATKSIEPPYFDETYFTLEGLDILSNFDEIYVRYIFNVTNTADWSPLFIYTLILHLAAIFAEPITGQIEKASFFKKRYEESLKYSFSKDVSEFHRTEDTRAALVDARDMSDARGAGNPLTQDR